jgi:hypothetical protein
VISTAGGPSRSELEIDDERKVVLYASLGVAHHVDGSQT